MIAGHFSIKKDAKILTCKILFVALLANFGLTVLAPTASADYYPITTGDNCWEWQMFPGPGFDRITDLAIRDIADCDGEYDGDNFPRILDDLYDGFGLATVNASDPFVWSLPETFLEGGIGDNQIFIDNDPGLNNVTYTVTFADNNITYLISSPNPQDPLRIWGNLGSDKYTRFITLGGKLFSYQVRSSGENESEDGPQNFMPSYDPILLWETTAGASIKSLRPVQTPMTDDNGDTIFDEEGYPVTVTTFQLIDTLENFLDYVNVSFTGNILQLKHSAFAYQINGAVYETNNQANDRSNNQKNTDRFFAEFLNFVTDNPNRTDIFTYNFINLAPVQSLRQTANLSFSQSLYGADTLSDPDGQLRKTLDSINAKYGNLLK